MLSKAILMHGIVHLNISTQVSTGDTKMIQSRTRDKVFEVGDSPLHGDTIWKPMLEFAKVTRAEEGSQGEPWLIPSDAEVKTKIKVIRMKKKRVYEILPYLLSKMKQICIHTGR